MLVLQDGKTLQGTLTTAAEKLEVAAYSDNEGDRGASRHYHPTRRRRAEHTERLPAGMPGVSRPAPRAWVRRHRRQDQDADLYDGSSMLLVVTQEAPDKTSLDSQCDPVPALVNGKNADTAQPFARCRLRPQRRAMVLADALTTTSTTASRITSALRLGSGFGLHAVKTERQAGLLGGRLQPLQTAARGAKIPPSSGADEYTFKLSGVICRP